MRPLSAWELKTVVESDCPVGFPESFVIGDRVLFVDSNYSPNAECDMSIEAKIRMAIGLLESARQQMSRMTDPESQLARQNGVEE